MLPQKVIFKGVRDGVLVMVDAAAGADELMACLLEHSRLGRDFFSGATAFLDIRGGELSEAHVLAMTRFLVSEMGFSEVKMSVIPQRPQSAIPVPAGAAEPVADVRSYDVPSHIAAVPSGEATMFVKRTLRSGQKVNYVGNVIVVGDVNPGAEVVAGGDIIILGALRGVAHSGATGNDASSVFALRLQPTQLRIASFIARPPDGDNRVPRAPEVASIKDGKLVIETYASGNRE